jgi:hypothetical protein
MSKMVRFMDVAGLRSALLKYNIRGFSSHARLSRDLVQCRSEDLCACRRSTTEDLRILERHKGCEACAGEDEAPSSLRVRGYLSAPLISLRKVR